MNDVLIVIAPAADPLRKADLAAITFAQQVAGQTGGACDLLLMGPHASPAAEPASRLPIRTVLTVEHEALAQFTAENYAAAVANVVIGRSYRLIAAAASTTTKDYFPRLAAALDAAMASDVLEVLDVAETSATFLRAVFAGNLLAETVVDGATILATCRASSFESAQPGETTATVESVTVTDEIAYARKRFVAMQTTQLDRPELTEAEVIISGGRGTKGDEGFKLINELADLLGAAVGASRAAVDSGWMPNDFQVGQTGKIVAPKLYIAVGLSGAIQHLAGMRNSKTIVAINKDPEAPIFEVADLGLVGDLFKVLPELEENL